VEEVEFFATSDLSDFKSCFTGLNMLLSKKFEMEYVRGHMKVLKLFSLAQIIHTRFFNFCGKFALVYSLWGGQNLYYHLQNFHYHLQCHLHRWYHLQACRWHCRWYHLQAVRPLITHQNFHLKNVFYKLYKKLWKKIIWETPKMNVIPKISFFMNGQSETPKKIKAINKNHLKIL